MPGTAPDAAGPAPGAAGPAAGAAGTPGAGAGQAGGAYQPPPQPGYATQYPTGYPAAPRQPLDLAKLATLAAWVVLGLFALYYLYFISNDDNGGEFVDRFFGGMDRLGEGIFYAGILHAVGVWLRRNPPG
ncbi:MAG TPA: hypothetical protein VIL48_20260 [Acidimicrobiales bacterium]